MGIVKNINYGRFPKQGSHLGKSVEVCFHYDMTRRVPGIVVRDDAEDPWVTIIRLEDGYFVLATECHYTLSNLNIFNGMIEIVKEKSEQKS